MNTPYRVAVIGRTGRGNYGHGLDVVWKDIPGVKIVAVADEDPEGLKRAVARLDHCPGFLDYKEMLASVKPDIVSICPRWIDAHHTMTLRAIEAGVRGIYLEKPLCQTLEQADSMVQASLDANVKIGIAHQTRYSPILTQVERLVDEGKIGTLLEIHARGKEDQRGGGEDLWVLGTHVLNLMQYFAGEASWCFANLQENKQPVTPRHIRQGAEGLGLLAGDQVRALYGFPGTLTGSFLSNRNEAANPSRFGITLKGSKGQIWMGTGYLPEAYWLPDGSWVGKRSGKDWIRISSKGPDEAETLPDGGLHAGNLLACRDLLQALEQDRQPESSILDARSTLELIAGVFLSHRRNRPVSFPLDERTHPFENWVP